MEHVFAAAFRFGAMDSVEIDDLSVRAAERSPETMSGQAAFGGTGWNPSLEARLARERICCSRYLDS
jgi:hypothetical protein